ncbi:uncharacterized protein LOC119229271 isoform X2 [Pungitius pungitius]|uniref:uncharacterized protein LOC119229271 isoform X2 n=1 Tax=Pungitius pungitius TaxID=134920 RepID=UPI002E119EDC
MMMMMMLRKKRTMRTTGSLDICSVHETHGTAVPHFSGLHMYWEGLLGKQKLSCAYGSNVGLPTPNCPSQPHFEHDISLQAEQHSWRHNGIVEDSSAFTPRLEKNPLSCCVVLCVSLPAPSNVSISSFNLEHKLCFLPGLETPSDIRFTVQILRLRRRMWRPVTACSELRAGQTCDLTHVFKDPSDPYRARVQAFTFTQTSNWTVSERFTPLSDIQSESALQRGKQDLLSAARCGVLCERLCDITHQLQLRGEYTSLCLHQPTSAHKLTAHAPQPAGSVLCVGISPRWTGRFRGSAVL